MMKPMLGLSLHVSMPACVHVLGTCADTGATKINASSDATAIRKAYISIVLLGKGFSRPKFTGTLDERSRNVESSEGFRAPQRLMEISSTRLLNHLVGPKQGRRRYRHAERLCGLQIQYKFKPRGRL